MSAGLLYQSRAVPSCHAPPCVQPPVCTPACIPTRVLYTSGLGCLNFRSWPLRCHVPIAIECGCLPGGSLLDLYGCMHAGVMVWHPQPHDWRCHCILRANPSDHGRHAGAPEVPVGQPHPWLPERQQLHCVRIYLKHPFKVSQQAVTCDKISYHSAGWRNGTSGSPNSCWHLN